MTTKRSRIVRLFAALLAVGLLAAACGDDDDSGEGVSDTDLGGQTVTVGVENAYLPFNYVPAGESEGQGWDYDAWREICRIANCEAEFVVAGWPAVIDQVAQGEIDTAADGISITDERKEIVAYSQAYMTVDQKFIVGIDEDRYASADDIIKDVENGIYIVGRGSFSIDQQRYNFQFGGQLFYEIKDGKITEQIEDVAYQSNTQEFWNNCTKLAGKSDYRLGGSFFDGKGQPPQVSAVSHGCPTTRFNNINVINTARKVG